MQVVFIENYCVSAAEVLVPATDLSEQISTAGKEASGTGNMKFMMNGAITIGTMDGANVEICQEVGEENMFVFGAKVQDINYMEQFNSYKPGEVYEKNEALRNALTHLIDGSLPVPSDKQFLDIYHSLVFGDYERADKYYVLYDFNSYKHAFERMLATYENADKWNHMAAMNTACSGVFSSDRTIKEYNSEIWHLDSLD